MRKNKRLHFALDEDDNALLCYLARKAGMSNSAYIRTLLRNGSVEYYSKYTSEEAQKLLSAFCGISSSISSVAHNTRMKRSVGEDDFSRLESILISLVEVVDEHIFS